MDKPTQQAEQLAKAEEIINLFMDYADNLEARGIPRNQATKDLVGLADDWLKWKNNEMTTTEIQNTFNIKV